MKWIGQHIWDLTSRFRNDIYFEGLAETAETRGLVVDANGKVSINPLSGDEHATHIYENVRNDEGATIPVGTPVYSKGEIGGSERILVGIADASDPTKMPAIGITNTELTTTGDTKDGLITLVGVYNTNISGFTGLSENDIVYVASGGGLTITKPTGVNLIQNVGIILKTNGTIIQGLAVTCIGRTNDVPTPLYIDHANQRVGVGATSPTSTLQVDGTTFINDGILKIAKDSVTNYYEEDQMNSYGTFYNWRFAGTTVMHINSSGNVGIGTSSPSSLLHIEGSAPKIQFTDTSTSASSYIDADSAFGSLNIMADQGNSVASSQINLLVDGSSKMVIKDTGNVGIGTTSPGKFLDVNGTFRAIGEAFFNGSIDVTAGLNNRFRDGTALNFNTNRTARIFTDNNDLIIQQGEDDKDIIFKCDDGSGGVTEYLRIDGSNGYTVATKQIRFNDNVTAKFGSAGDMSIYHDGSNSYIDEAGTGNLKIRSNRLQLEKYTGETMAEFIADGASSLYYDNNKKLETISSGVKITGTIGNLGSGIGQQLEYGSSAVATLRFDADRWRLYAGGTSSELMTVQENGNVGIGTTSPASPLHVNTGAGTGNANTVFIDRAGSSDYSGVSFATAGTVDWSIGQNIAGNLEVFEDGLDSKTRMTIEVGGNVGIGTASPGYKLDVVGDGIRSTRSTAGWAGWFENTGSSSGVVVTAGVDSGDAPLLIRKQDGTELFSVRGNGTSWFKNGNVGIGTTSPSAKLHVNGDVLIESTNPALFFTDTNSDSDYSIKVNGGILSVRDETNDAARISLKSNGNVGIGTTSPNALLDVDNRIYLQNDGTVKWGASANAGHLTWGTNQAIVKGLSGQALLLGSNNTSARMTIDTSGNVGIGTTSPSGKLEVTDGTVILRPNTAGSALTWRESDNGNIGGQLRSYANRGDIYLYKDGVVRTEISSLDDSFIPRLHIGGTNQASEALQVTGNAIITGDLTVQGTTVTLDTTNLNVEDKNITLNYSTGDSSGSADGAGITIQDAVDASNDATMLWNASSDRFDFSHPITAKDNIRFVTSSGTDGGLIDMNSNNDLVISNPLGDVLLGDGSADVFIGDGTNNVDIRFEQSGSITADNTSATLTIGGTGNLVVEEPTINNPTFSGAFNLGSKLTLNTSNGYILFDYEPAGDTGEYTTEVPLLKVDHNGTEKTILSRISENGGIQLGHDDSVLITAGDVGDEIKSNWGATNENVVLASEAGFYALAFPNNSTTWSNRNIFRFYGGDATAANNGLYIGDGSSTQFIDLDRNISAASVTAGNIKAMGGGNLFVYDDDDDTKIHFFASSNSNEGFLQLSNGSNWGLLARGKGNDPRLGAYHNGYLSIWGFGSNTGADHADDDELARFDFANERFIVNGEISAGGNITTSSNSYIVSSRKFTARDANGTGLFADDAASGLSIADDGDATFTGDLTVNGVNYGAYHSVSEDQYYFDDYNGRRNLALFYKNARADIIRYQPVDNFEYWNGSAWVADSSQESNVKKLLDGRQDTSWNVPSTYYKFRFTTQTTTSWPTMAMIWMQTSWSGSTWPGATMLVEEYDGSSWATKVTAEFTNTNGITNWGLSSRADTALHTGNGHNADTTRITVDFYGWTPSNGSYTTIPLQNLMITSNYAGTENTDYTNLLDYDRDVAIPNDMTVGGNTTMSGNLTINSTYPRIFLTDSNHNDDWSIINNDGKFGIYNDTDTSYALSINGSNNVGIGTTSPESKLHITDANPILIMEDTSNPNKNKIENVDGNMRYHADYNSNMGNSRHIFFIDNSEKVRFEANGNVGIGTTSPSELLTIAAESPTLRFEDISSSNYTEMYVNNFDTYLNTNGRFFIQNQGSTKVTFKSDGNVGIGTTSPSEKLEVNGNIKIGDNQRIAFGSGDDLRITHDSTNSYIQNFTGHLNITNQADDGDIKFSSDDGSGGVAEYFRLDGALGYTRFWKHARLEDNVELRVGTGNDLKIYHDGTNNYIQGVNGDLYIQNGSDDKDIILRSDDGSGGQTAYLTLDGSAGYTVADKDIYLVDDVRLRAGTGGDFSFFHDGSNSKINNNTGNIRIENFQDDGDIQFFTDDGSGGTAEYFRLDGGDAKIYAYKDIKFGDGVSASFGNNDYLINHNGTNSVLSNYTGNLQINNYSDDGDIILSSDDGSGGLTAYLTIDGSTERVNFNKPIKIVDSTAINVGSGLDLRLTHDGTDSLIQNFEGNLEIQQRADDKDIIFQCDDGSGGTTTYLRVDGGDESIKFYKDISNQANANLVMGGGQIKFSDAGRFYAGDSNDLQIYHDGSHSYIKENGTGNLRVDASNFYVRNSGGTKIAIDALDGAEVALRYDGSRKLETTSTGVEVTGDLTVNNRSVQTAQMVVTTHNFQMANTTGTFFYVPFNNLNESSTASSAEYWTRSIAPYAGTIKKVIVRSHTSLGSSCQIRVSKITDTTDDLPSGTHVTNTGIDISTANTSVSTTMSTNTFAEGDVVGVALSRSAGSSARVVVTIVWEYTV